ncbi:MAG: DUF1934 domain-containing protein [Acutalibacteraceae bacterium]|jgi:uncharacterized beta-barrel protein YwiB (DUF1934 family)
MKVRLRVTGRQTVDGQTDETVLDLPGTLTALDDGWEIVYHQREEGQAITTRVRVTDGMMTVTRSGDAASTLRLKPGKPLNARYDTGYGVLPMTIQTDLLLCDLTPSGGRVTARYRLIIGGMTAGHELTMEVKQEERVDHVHCSADCP